MMNSKVAKNFEQLKPVLLVFPVVLLGMIALFLITQNAFSTTGYVEIQKSCFYEINSALSQFPEVIYNLTQIGDAMVFLSLIGIFIVLAPKIWEAAVPAALFSLLFSKLFKSLFSVPRPAGILDQDSFHIIGKTLVGFSSLPSGHSITVFTFLTVLMYGFMPKDLGKKILWFAFVVCIGLFVAFTRVGVGAHYPLDVVSGSITGYICGVLGIFTMRKFNLFGWLGQKKWFPFLILAFLVCVVIFITKIRTENLPVFYVAIVGLVVSLYKMIKVYVQK